MKTKTILGLSLAAAFAIAMIGPAFAELAGWSEITKANTKDQSWTPHPKDSSKDKTDRLMITAHTIETFTSCPASEICGVGSFIATGSALNGVAAAMAVAAIHDPFCDHTFQHASCDPGSLGTPVPIDGDADAPHPHVLQFVDAEGGCAALNGFDVELFAENDLSSADLKISDTKLGLKFPKSDEILSIGSEVHTWTVDIGTGGEICPVILDTFPAP